MASRNRFLGAVFQPTPFRPGLQLRPYVVALGLIVLAWSLLLAALTLLLADRVALLSTGRLLLNIASNALVITSSYLALRLVVRGMHPGTRRRIGQGLALCLVTGLWTVLAELTISYASYVSVWLLYLIISAAGYWLTRRIVLMLNAAQAARLEQEQKRIYEMRSALYSFGIDIDGYYLVEFVDALSQVSDRKVARRYLSLANAFLRRRIQLSEAKAWTLGAALDEVRLLCELNGLKIDVRLDQGVDGGIESTRFPPLLLSRLIDFLAAYAQERFTPLRIRIRLTEVDESVELSIETNLPASALLYDSPGDSAATKALCQFRDHLNRVKRYGIVFERERTSEGNLVVTFIWSRIPQAQNTDRSWEDIISLIPTDTPQLLASGWTDFKVYRQQSLTWKVARTTTPEKTRSLEGEFQILRRLEGLPCVPKPRTYFANHDVEFLAYEYTAGSPADEHLSRKLPDTARIRFLCNLSDAISSINAEGVFHRDLKPSNVLVGDSDNVCIIDFDQAIYMPSEQRIEWDNGLKAEIHGIHNPNDLLSQLGLAEQVEAIADELASVWALAGQSDANSPGQGLSYYHWNFCGRTLAGERPWLDRWLPLRAYLGSVRGMTVLELGCNLGLLSCYMALNGASEVIGVDIDNDILVAAERLARTLCVGPTFRQSDLNSPQDLATLNAHYDVVFVLSVTQWLSNVNPLLDFLARQECVVFEGHLSTRDEIAMFRRLGFSKVDVICYTERLRAMLCARK